MRGQGGNLAVREWVGGGLKVLGELMEREQEDEDGERKMVVDEVLVSSDQRSPLFCFLSGVRITDLNVLFSFR